MQPEGTAAAPLHGRMVRLAVSDARFRGRLAKAGLLVGGRYVCRVLRGKVRARLARGAAAEGSAPHKCLRLTAERRTRREFAQTEAAQWSTFAPRRLRAGPASRASRSGCGPRA